MRRRQMGKTKYKRQNGARWTDADLAHLRAMHQQSNLSYREMGDLLGRSYRAIAQQLYHMKKRDAVEGYVHVSDTITTQDAIRKVHLTEGQVQIAKGLGLTLEQYARGVILAEQEYHVVSDATTSTLNTKKPWWKRLLGM
jgi:hypothetical protein